MQKRSKRKRVLPYFIDKKIKQATAIYEQIYFWASIASNRIQSQDYKAVYVRVNIACKNFLLLPGFLST